MLYGIRSMSRRRKSEAIRRVARSCNSAQRELGDPIDGDKQIELSRFGPDLCKIDVDVPDWVGLELPARPTAFHIRQTADGVALGEAVQRGPRQMWDGRLQRIEAIIEG